MLKRLENYYAKNRILATSFKCVHKKEYKGSCDTFTGPKSTYVGTKYGRSNIPRLLFLSLDSGNGPKNPKQRLPVSVREKVLATNVSDLPESRHWYRTHELAWYIHNNFVSELSVEDVRLYFAHANSAKCSMNKSHGAKADKRLFKNCQKYLEGELNILKPDILVTQGREAESATSNLITKRRSLAG